MSKMLRFLTALGGIVLFLIPSAIPALAWDGQTMPWNTPRQNQLQQLQQPQLFQGSFSQANNSGVSGTTQVMLSGNQLTITIMAYNLSPNQPHDMHIHGFADNHQSVCAGPQADTNGDGFVSTAEATPFIGPIMLPLDTVTPNDSRMISYQKTVTVDPNQMQPLQSRVVEIHGLWVNNGYNSDLPVACAPLTQVGGNAWNWQNPMKPALFNNQHPLPIVYQLPVQPPQPTPQPINFQLRASNNGVSGNGQCLQWNGSMCTVMFYPGQ